MEWWQGWILIRGRACKCLTWHSTPIICHLKNIVLKTKMFNLDTKLRRWLRSFLPKINTLVGLCISRFTPYACIHSVSDCDYNGFISHKYNNYEPAEPSLMSNCRLGNTACRTRDNVLLKQMEFAHRSLKYDKCTACFYYMIYTAFVFMASNHFKRQCK